MYPFWLLLYIIVPAWSSIHLRMVEVKMEDRLGQGEGRGTTSDVIESFAAVQLSHQDAGRTTPSLSILSSLATSLQSHRLQTHTSYTAQEKSGERKDTDSKRNRETL